MKQRKFIAAVIATLIAGQALALDAASNDRYCPIEDPLNPTLVARNDRFHHIVHLCLSSPECDESLRKAVEDGKGAWAEVKDELTVLFDERPRNEWSLYSTIAHGPANRVPTITLQHDYIDSFRQIPASTPAGFLHRRVAGSFIRDGAAAMVEGATATITARDDDQADQVVKLYRRYGAKATFERVIDPAAKLVTIKINQAAN